MKLRSILTKITISLFMISTFSFANYAYSYDEQKGQIDMHGGKGDKLGSSSGFSNSLGLGSALNKKEAKKEDKDFLKIEKIEDIKKEDIKKND